MAARFCATTWVSRQRGTRQLPTNSLLLRSAQLDPPSLRRPPFPNPTQTIPRRQIQTSQALTPSDPKPGAKSPPPSNRKSIQPWLDYILCGLLGYGFASLYFQRKDRRLYRESVKVLGQVDVLASAAHTPLGLEKHDGAFFAWLVKALVAVPPTTEEGRGLRAFAEGEIIRSRIAVEYFRWKLERIRVGEEWLDKGYRKAREEKKKELDLVIEAQMKEFQRMDSGEPIKEKSEGPSEKKEE
jgi:hypothetical protein